MVQPHSSPYAGTLAARPPAGVANRYYWSTDENKLYRDTGAAWVELAVSGAQPPVRKTANQVINNDNAYQDDLHLKLTVAANEVWALFAYIRHQATVAAGIKFQWTIPAAATLQVITAGLIGALAGGTSVLTPQNETYPGALAGVAAERVLIEWLLYIGGANAGTLQLQWAQVVAEATDATVFANSFIIPHKLA